MRNIIAIACIACIVGPLTGAYGQGKVTTTVHTNKYGQQSTTVTTHGTLQTFGPAKTVDNRLPIQESPTFVLGGSSVASGYVATLDGRTWWTGATYGEAERHRLAMDAIKYHRTIVLRLNGRLLDAIEP
jgi:hypothetical protein